MLLPKKLPPIPVALLPTPSSVEDNELVGIDKGSRHRQNSRLLVKPLAISTSSQLLNDNMDSSNMKQIVQSHSAREEMKRLPPLELLVRPPTTSNTQEIISSSHSIPYSITTRALPSVPQKRPLNDLPGDNLNDLLRIHPISLQPNNREKFYDSAKSSVKRSLHPSTAPPSRLVRLIKSQVKKKKLEEEKDELKMTLVALSKREDGFVVQNANAISNYKHYADRSACIQTLYYLKMLFNLDNEILYLAINMLDRYLVQRVPDTHSGRFAAVVVLIAMKLLDDDSPLNYEYVEALHYRGFSTVSLQEFNRVREKSRTTNIFEILHQPIAS